jgi:hypothetical protein
VFPVDDLDLLTAQRVEHERVERGCIELLQPVFCPIGAALLGGLRLLAQSFSYAVVDLESDV